jgi:hypothetical protein
MTLEIDAKTLFDNFDSFFRIADSIKGAPLDLKKELSLRQFLIMQVGGIYG